MHPWGRLAGIGITLAVALAARVVEAKESRVSLVVSRVIGPYLEAAEGAKDVLQSHPIKATVDWHDLQGDVSQGGEVASTIRLSHPDLIFTIGTEATQLISERFSNIPTVFAMVVRPEAFAAEHPWMAGVSMEVHNMA